VVGLIEAAEKEAALAAGVDPTRLLVKGNLWLPIGGPLHVSRDRVIGILMENFRKIVNRDAQAVPKARVFPSVSLDDGRVLAFDGAYAAIAGAGIITCAFAAATSSAAS
jgi:hypothetical protein